MGCCYELVYCNDQVCDFNLGCGGCGWVSGGGLGLFPLAVVLAVIVCEQVTLVLALAFGHGFCSFQNSW